jgi:hypothetical protein
MSHLIIQMMSHFINLMTPRQIKLTPVRERVKLIIDELRNVSEQGFAIAKKAIPVDK